jgi:signal transduction histidine kinase
MPIVPVVSTRSAALLHEFEHQAKKDSSSATGLFSFCPTVQNEVSDGEWPMNARLLIRMTAPVVATSLLLLAVSVGTAWQVQRWQKRVAHDLRVNVPGMRAGEELEIFVREIRTQLHLYLITGERKYLDSAPSLQAKTERWLAEAERWALTPHEQELVARAQQGYRHFLTALKRIRPQAAPETAPAQVRNVIDGILVEEILAPAHAYLEYNEDEVEQSIAQNQVFADRLVYGLLTLGICGSGAGLAAGFGFARGLGRSLIQLSVPIRAAAGQLDEVVGPLTFTGADIPQLEGVLRQIADRIGAVVERLRQSEREALRAEQLAALGQMAAAMAHELRNPLTSMKIIVQGAQSAAGWGEENPALSDRDLQILEEEISRLETVIQTFFDFARPAQPKLRSLDVRPLVEQTLELVAAQASSNRVRVEWSASPGPVRAAVDPGQLRQVVLNLLLNALDAVPRGGVIQVTLGEGPSGGLILRVADSGCGLPAALGSRIFAPFTTTKETGLGLGLSICKRIAEAHGATISAVNRPEGGAVFTLCLPPRKEEG